jgi:hypothetical protein
MIKQTQATPEKDLSLQSSQVVPMLWSAQQRRVLPIIYHAVSQKLFKFMAWVFGEIALKFGAGI